MSQPTIQEILDCPTVTQVDVFSNKFYQVLRTSIQQELIYCFIIHTGIEPRFDKPFNLYFNNLIRHGFSAEELQRLARGLVDSEAPFGKKVNPTGKPTRFGDIPQPTDEQYFAHVKSELRRSGRGDRVTRRRAGVRGKSRRK